MGFSKLRNKAKELSTQLPIMEGREKGNMSDLVGTPVTIRDFGFMKDDDEQYVVFVVDEDPANFYFGGMVLTDNMLEIEADGLHDDVTKEGLPVLFGSKKGKNNRTYTTVTFYPEIKEEVPEQFKNDEKPSKNGAKK